MGHGIEKALDIRISHPAHLLPVNPGVESVQRIVLTAPRSESIRKAEEILLVDGLQNVHDGLLNDPQSHRTALRPRQPLGSAEVTHPFHPLRGHRFVVLKIRSVSGIETLSLRHSELGSFAMPREWTDWAPPNAQVTPAGGQPLITD